MSQSIAVVALLFCVWLASAAAAMSAARKAKRGRESRDRWRRYFGGLALKGWHSTVADHLYICDVVWTRVL